MSQKTFIHESRNLDKLRTYDIMGDLKVHVTVTDNPFDLPLDALFSMAARINKKRAFLFVSKILGKHLPVQPHVSLLSGALLGLLLQRELNGSAFDPELLLAGLRDPSEAKQAYQHLQAHKWTPPRPLLFIGFAETATALGHSMFDAFAENCRYFHTTRELIQERSSTISFEEEHSHAMAHRCYADVSIREGEAIVLVDDEMTTGKTTLNIIRELHAQCPVQDYYVASLLDWRSTADQQKFAELEAELGISIRTLALVKGEIEVQGLPILEGTGVKTVLNRDAAQIETLYVDDLFEPVFVSSLDTDGNVNGAPYLQCTGRFGIDSAANRDTDSRITQAAERLRAKRTGGKTICLGTGEFMYLPMRIAAEMGEGVSYQSTTRSPIHPHDDPSYAIVEAHPFPSPEDPQIGHFLYNLTPYHYDDLFVFMERAVKPEQLAPFVEMISHLGIKQVYLVVMSQRMIPAPEPIGSYDPDDVIFLLKNLQNASLESSNENRERLIQSGIHYSEMLPVEYRPSQEYLQLFHQSLAQSAEKIALAAGTVAELLVSRRGTGIVLVSLARGGTPIGILIKRYLQQHYGISLPHYSISILRGKGIDENALLYMLQNHPGQQIQFVDGWTGKGAIRQVLKQACADFARTYGVTLSDDLAVLADPGYCSETFGTREDFLIPSACLNSTVSGLVSRTVLHRDLIGPLDFHGAKFYEEWREDDLSNLFVDTVSQHFAKIGQQAKQRAEAHQAAQVTASWQGLKQVQQIQAQYGLPDLNLVKPGIGETTRVLLRRVPWKILVDRLDNPNLQHILLLAAERQIPVEVVPDLMYSCFGLIQPVKGEVQ